VDNAIKELKEVAQNTVKEVNLLLPQLSQNALPLTVEDLELIIRDVNTHLLVCVKNEKIIGMLTLTTSRIPTGIKSMIEDVVVDVEYRKFGIARDLVDFALNIAKELGSKSVELTSRPSREAANKLYVTIGFKIRETNVYRYTFD
jgi:ribosomal protein S18 acetylase RimI-like enzyme